MKLTYSNYSTAQFTLDICMRVLIQSLEKFVTELVSLLRAYDSWHTFDPRDELYVREVQCARV